MHFVIDPKTGKKVAEQSLEKLKAFMKDEKQAKMFTAMNRKQRRKFYAQNKKLIGK